MVQVSILMPFCNARETIAEAVASILRQTFADFEFILIDDGSTDDSASIVGRTAAEDTRVRVVRHGENRGLVERLNEGLKLCRGEFIARMDADDRSHAMRLQRQIAYLRRNETVLAVSGVILVLDQGRGTTRVYKPDEDADHDKHAIPAHEPYLPHPFLTVRASALAEIGGYRHVLHAEDADLYWRLVEIGEIRNMPDLVGDYRVHADSVSARSAANGRVQTAFSQLAALSACRRAAGRPDIDFTEERSRGAVAHSQSFAALVDYMNPEFGLDEAERRYLKAAMVVKYLYQSKLRPYVLEPVDAGFAFDALSLALEMTPDQGRKHHFRQLCRETFRATIERGSYADAARLLLRNPRNALFKPRRNAAL